MLHACLPGVQPACFSSYSRLGSSLWPDKASADAGPVGRPRSRSHPSLGHSLGRLSHPLTALRKDAAEDMLPLQTEGLHVSMVEPRQHTPWQHAAAGALQAGWRLASRTFHLANLIMCTTILRLRRREAAVRQQVAAEQAKGLEAFVQSEQAARATIVACSAGVLGWLCSLGNPNIPLEDKWAGVQSLLPAQQELGESMQTLYSLATESSGTLQKAVAAAGQQLSAETQRQFHKSEHTQRVIEQEAALKQLVFAQVLSGSMPA